MHITITGDLGSGKSSVAKILCKKLHYTYFSTGNVQRELSKKEGIDTLQMNYLAEKNANIDQYIDDLTKNINTKKENYVLDSRMAWYFIKESFKVYLTVDTKIAALRIMNDKNRSSEPLTNDLEQKTQNLKERKLAEKKRFIEKYKVDYTNLSNYNLILDSSKFSQEEIAEKIIIQYKQFLKNNL